MNGRERHAGDRLAALVDGRLGEPDRSRVVEHLTHCRDCLADYDAQLTLKGLLRGLDAPPAPQELRERLSDMLAGQRAEPVTGRVPVSRRARLSAAAVAFSFVAAGGAYLLGGADEATPVVPPVDQYVREHAAVSVRVPLTGPVLYQLVQAPSSMLVTPATAAVGRS